MPWGAVRTEKTSLTKTGLKLARSHLICLLYGEMYFRMMLQFDLRCRLTARMEEQSRASARNRNELSHVASQTLGDVQKSAQVQGPSESEAHATV